MEKYVLVAVTVHSPYLAASEVTFGPEHGIIGGNVNAQTDTREHQFPLHAKLRSGDSADLEQILLEIQCGDTGSGRHRIAEFGFRLRGSE